MRVLTLVCLLLLAITVQGCCNSNHTDNSKLPAIDPAIADSGSLDIRIEQFFHTAMSRLGKDPLKTPSDAPQGSSNAVFDLQAEQILDIDTPVGIRLQWTERMVRDTDQNGNVNISDLTQIGVNFQGTVDYDPADEHGGVIWWPAGFLQGATYMDLM